MRDSVRLVTVLTVIAVLSGLVLAFTFVSTEEEIALHQAEAKKAAVSQVLGGLQDYQAVERNGQEFYQGELEGDRVVALEVSGSGFQGQIRLMAGFNLSEQRIIGIKILEHLETPGLGARITGDFKDQFAGKKIFDSYQVVKTEAKSNKQIEAISGATISSNAVTSIVMKAVGLVNQEFGGEL
ncbi:MAG: RnfABCDGE type electron transport complex subunit G [Halanaerobium sp.]|nr:RnfABCDGE type electron transport complex subunit G [Halanaerobium sp.]